MSDHTHGAPNCFLCSFAEHLQRELCDAYRQEHRVRVLELEHLLRRIEVAQ